MKSVILFAVFALAAADIEYYTTADDHLDIDGVIADLPRLYHFIGCFLDRTPCSELTASYRKIIPESVVTQCKKCNPEQKHLANRFLLGLKVVLPLEYANFRRKYDPRNEHFDAFEAAIKNY